MVWDIRVLLLSGEGGQGPIVRQLAILGGKVDVGEELFAALSEVIDDPAGYALLVVDRDGVGGLHVALRGLQILGAMMTQVRVLLVSCKCKALRFRSVATHDLARTAFRGGHEGRFRTCSVGPSGLSVRIGRRIVA